MRKIIVVTVFFWLASCSGDNKVDSRLLVFGDSISASSHLDTSYPKLLENYCGFTQENYSISGTSLEEKNQIGKIREITILPTDIVIFSPGINDAYFHKTDPKYLAQYETQLKEALDKFEASGAASFLGTPILGQEDGDPNYRIDRKGMVELNANAAKYSDILVRLFHQGKYKNIQLVNAREAYVPTNKNMKNSVHPNHHGNLQLFEIFRTAIGPRCSPSQTRQFLWPVVWRAKWLIKDIYFSLRARLS